MNKFAIITDMTCDMPKEFYKENDIDVASMSFVINDVEYNRDHIIDSKEFYQLIRAGAVPRTSQTDLDDVRSLMEKRLQNGEDVLYVCFSSGVSGSYDNINNIVRRELLEQYPERKINVIDSLGGSCGLGLLIRKACQMRAEGKNIEEVANWLDDNKLRMHHFYVIGDLKLLMKGGRISKTQAILGTIIGLKPIVMLDTKGQNHVIGKAKGKKKAMNMLLDLVARYIDPDDNDILMTTDTDCEEDVAVLNAKLKEVYHKDVTTVPLTYMVGSHVGADTMGVFFFAKEPRTP